MGVVAVRLLDDLRTPALDAAAVERSRPFCDAPFVACWQMRKSLRHLMCIYYIRMKYALLKRLYDQDKLFGNEVCKSLRHLMCIYTCCLRISFLFSCTYKELVVIKVSYFTMQWVKDCVIWCAFTLTFSLFIFCIKMTFEYLVIILSKSLVHILCCEPL